MAKIGEEFSHVSLSIKPYFRLPTAKSKNKSFFVNDGRNTVLKIKDQKILQSWTLVHPDSFTCPVVASGNEELYCVQNSKTLLRWSADDETMKNAATFKSKESIFAVVPLSQMKPVIIFASGNAVSAENLPSLKHHNNMFLRGDEIVWVSAANFLSKMCIVFLSAKNKNKHINSYKLHSYVLDEDGISNYSSELLQLESEEMKCWCFNKSSLKFCLLWSNGVVQTLHLPSKERSVLMTLPEVPDGHLFAMDYIDPNHMALVRCNPASKEIVLEIWDVLFSTLKERKNLKNSSVSSIQLSVIESAIFLSFNEELLELNFCVEKSTLESATGKMRAPSCFKSIWSQGKVFEDDTRFEKMDTLEQELVKSPTELMALKLMKEGSSHMKYISESDLVKLLRLAVRLKMNREDNDSKIDPDVVLASVFTSSFSDVFLGKLMKSLNSEEALVTLEILQLLLEDKSSLSRCPLKITDLQIFNWICLVIHSHMETVLLSKDRRCIMVLKELDTLLLEKLEEYEDYESIQSLFLALGEKKILPEKYVDSRYCIETLET